MRDNKKYSFKRDRKNNKSYLNMNKNLQLKNIDKEKQIVYWTKPIIRIEEINMSCIKLNENN